MMFDITPNLKAFLDLIGWSEGTILIPGSDDGYNVICGSTPKNPDLFALLPDGKPNYADHPRKEIWFPNLKLHSSAAGRYQLESHWFDAYKQIMNLPDFSPSSQDQIALKQIKESGAMDLVTAGRIYLSLMKCSHIWASFPGNNYNQPMKKVDVLRNKFVSLGGKLADSETAPPPEVAD